MTIIYPWTWTNISYTCRWKPCSLTGFYVYVSFFKTRRMKSFELNAWGLEEVSVSESIAVNGGQACIPWGIVLEYLARIFAGGVVGWSIYEMFSEEEVIEIYGGELDPAICVG